MFPIGLYRALLRFYPAPFRREYGSEMAGAFAEQVQQARQDHSPWTEASLWLHALVDLVHIAPKEHLHVIRQDMRYAIRTLASNPGFAAVAILSLALGIGANTAIFSLLNSVLLSALPVRDPQQLVLLSDPNAAGVFVGSQGGDRSLLTYAEFEQLRGQPAVFSDVMAAQSISGRMEARVEGGEPEQIRTRMVSAEYFRTLGVPPLLGRTFDVEETRVEGGAPYAVISYDYWQRRFGGRAGILDVPIALRGGVFSIIGVMPPAFFGETVGERPDVWLPLSMQAVVLPGPDWLHDNPANVEKVMWLRVFGRLRPGVSIEQADAASNVIFQQGLAAYYGSGLTPEDHKNFLNQHLKLRPAATGASQLRRQFSEPLWMLLAASGLILLIACANLGNLLLARATARSRELSVRLALGASRGRLIRQLLTESAVLALLGGAAGLVAAYLLRAGLLRLVSDSIVLDATPDARVLAFVFALTLLAGLLLGIFPALRTTKVEAAAGLKEQGRGVTGSASWLRLGKFIVVGQLALSLPLLVGAALLVQTLYNLQRVDIGYAKDRLLLVEIDAQTAGYEPSRWVPLFDRLLERIRAVPGVRAATYSNNGLFQGSDSHDEILVEGYTAKGDNDRGSGYDHIGPSYFSTLGIPVILGREITAEDQPSASKVCVINEAFAKMFFDGRPPLGMHVTQVYGNQRNTFQIVGVAKDVRTNRIRGEINPRFYVPATQPVTVPNRAIFEMRTAGEPSSVLAGVRGAVREIDPNLPIASTSQLDDLLNEGMVQDRLLARLSIAFGVVALLLASVGLYGILSYGVTRRTNEIGIRKALGAQHSAVMSMVLRETGLLLAIGLAAGIALAAMALRLIQSRLYGLASTDPTAFAVGIAVLSAVGLAAAWFPAYRASRVDPLIALRHE